MRVYFKMAVADLDETVMDKSVDTNPFTLRKTIDGVYCMVEFDHDGIPLKMLTLGLTALNQEEAFSEVSGEDWQSEI